jgi:hypothetical protein
MEPAISVEIGHPSLRQAIEAQIRAASEVANWESGANREIVISTTSDLSPSDCRELSSRGAIVIILAAFPSSAAASAYRDAGACYGPMVAGETGWVDCVRRLARRSREKAEARD